MVAVKTGERYIPVMIYVAEGSRDREIGLRELEILVGRSLDSCPRIDKAIALPPDYTRLHSMAGPVTDALYRALGDRLAAVMPALGTHSPMTATEIASMYPGTPAGLFRAHDWRRDLVELGRVSASFVSEVSEGAVNYDWPAQTNRLLAQGGFDRIISIGQVVPHEVVGMANHAKNIFVGAGGKEGIDKSHFLGAAYGMERMMGRTDTPVRKVFDKAMEFAPGRLPPVLWMLTVVGRKDDGSLALRGFFSGDDRECFEKASALAREVNLEMLDEGIRKAVVWLDPGEYKSTWLGNKAIYRTRMAMADGGELLILAPGLIHFGEDPGIDALIRRFGYRPSAQIRRLAASEPDLAASLSAAAHLIHGSSESRFTVRYASGPGLSRKEIESVGFEWADPGETMKRYDPAALRQGFNTMPDGERIFFVPNPALGLWSLRSRFE